MSSVLYASTSAGGPGELYIIDQNTGSMVQDIGPLNDTSTVNYPMTGLAFDPITKVLYGSTSNSNPPTAHMLVRINPITAVVTPIGSFTGVPSGSTMTDLAFDASGNLYSIASVGGPNLYSINKTNASATLIGTTGIGTTVGGGLEISSTGTFYGTPTASQFGIYNSSNGSYTNIGNPTKPVGGSYAALTFISNSLYRSSEPKAPTS
jgi:hypothetical protein